MANVDGEINIKTKIDDSGLNKEVGGLKNKLNGLFNGNALGKVAKLGTAFGAVAVATKAVTSAVKECTDAYNVQKKAEVQLEAAAKNNPYLDSYNVKALKDYASELQNITAVGDETLLPLMAQLASTGRTQAEIQNIMSAALDVSAAGIMSLDSAVTQLNATYSGNVGLLGRQISELKDLTKEELENGKAIELIGKKYAGVAEEAAKATGAGQKLSNAWGDLKEELGAGWAEAVKPVQEYTAEVVSAAAAHMKAQREIKEFNNALVKGTLEANETNVAAYKRQLDDLQLELNKTKSNKRTNYRNDEFQDSYIETQLKNDPELIAMQNRVNEARQFWLKAKEDVENAKREAELAAQQLEEVKKAEEKAAAQAAKQKKIDDKNAQAQSIIDSNRESLKMAIARLNAEAKLKGTIVDETEILDLMEKHYISLVSTSSLVTSNNEQAKTALKEVEKYALNVAKVSEKYKDSKAAAEDFLDIDATEILSDSIQTTIDALELEREAIKDNKKQYEEYTKEITELTELQGKVKQKEAEESAKLANEKAQEQKQKNAELFASMNSYFSQFAAIVTQVNDLVRTATTAQNDAAQAELNEQYNDGLLSYEEYCEKKDEITKKAALEEYKLNMWAWSASLAQATANVAQGVAKAIAEGGAAGIITGALVGAAGAAQIASIVASKPQRPSFYTGGVVGGNNGASMGYDNTIANVRNGEMILNAAQQAQLWKVANGGNGGGLALNVAITNNVADSAKVSAKMTNNGLRVTVDRIVNAGLEDGRYTKGLSAADNNKTGALYL